MRKLIPWLLFSVGVFSTVTWSINVYRFNTWFDFMFLGWSLLILVWGVLSIKWSKDV